tara:strand:+ start:338 stop:562 length:225 start_codon:yes stop_codon:yes gene_type:complete
MKSKILIFGLLLSLIIVAGCTNNTDLNNCKVAYDGCNTCQVIDGKITSCTEIACGNNYLKKPVCKEYYKNDKPI